MPKLRSQGLSSESTRRQLIGTVWPASRRYLHISTLKRIFPAAPQSHVNSRLQSTLEMLKINRSGPHCVDVLAVTD